MKAEKQERGVEVEREDEERTNSASQDPGRELEEKKCFAESGSPIAKKSALAGTGS